MQRTLNNKNPTAKDYLLLTTLAAIFGLSFIFTNISVREVPPLTVTAARLFIALLIMYPIMFAAGQKLPRAGKIWIYVFLSGLFGNALPFALVSWGQVKVDAGLSAIFMAVMPLSTILLAQILTNDERINRWKMAGVLLGFAGIVVLMGKNSFTALGDEMLRQLAILIAAISYALNAIITRKLTALPKYSMVAALMVAGSILMVPASLLIDQPWGLSVHIESIGALVMLAVGSTAIATLLILVIIERCGATFLSQINFMVPLFGVLFGAVLLNERLAANAYIALAIILIALALSRRGQGTS